MANILFLAHRIPYPPNKGDKIRSWHFLSHLLEKHTVHLGFFVDDRKDLEHVSYLENMAESLCYEVTKPTRQKVRSLRGLVSGTSLTTSAYPYSRLKAYTDALIKAGDIDLIFLFSAATGPIIPAQCSLPVITDLVDVDSQKWDAYAAQAPWPLSWLYKRESITLASYEEELLQRSAETILVSKQEAELFARLNSKFAEKISAIENGVDLARFNPDNYSDARERNIVIFTGAMDYQPNIDAVTWFCREIWPTVMSNNKGTVFRIAGGPTTKQTEALKGLPGVEVLGYVPDMAKEIAKATVCVAPLRTARGIQNKVLEAMAMAKPTIATSLANEGINAIADEAILISDSADEFASKVCSVLDDTKTGMRLGKAARLFVETDFTWDKAYGKLDKLLSKCL